MSSSFPSNSSELLSKADAKARFSTLENHTRDKVRLLYIVVTGCLILTFAVRIMLMVETHVWSSITTKSREPELGYNMDPNDGSVGQDVQRVFVPYWQRVIRATLTFFRKYFCSVSVPVLNMTLAELALVLAYIGFMLYLLISDAHDVPRSVITPNFVVIGIANRSGKLALASLPFVVLLSNRVSLVAFLVGASYDRIQYLHRWVGRTCLGLAITHGTCKLIQSDSFADHSFRRFGLGAFCIACFAMLFNNRYVRRVAYEFFIAVHISIYISLTVMIWLHKPTLKAYLIATLAIWSSDRLARWTRIFLYNGLWRFGCRSPDSRYHATLRLLSHDTTRLEVYKHDFAAWRPGSFAYISTPGLSWWPCSHPFTIASRPYRYRWSTPGGGGGGGAQCSGSPSDGQRKSNEERAMYASGSKEILTYQPNLIFLIRAREGWTRKIHEMASMSSQVTIPVWIDGPYDSAPELHKCFDTVMLFAGGAGVSWTLPLLTDLIDRARHGRSNVRRLVWVCVLRHYVNYDWLFGELDAVTSLAGNMEMDIRIHYTTEPGDSSPVPSFFRHGRPDIAAIVEDGVSQAQGRVFIGSSGPAGPSYEVRRCARLMMSPSAVLRGDVRGDIHCHTELFGW